MSNVLLRHQVWDLCLFFLVSGTEGWRGKDRMETFPFIKVYINITKTSFKGIYELRESIIIQFAITCM